MPVAHHRCETPAQGGDERVVGRGSDVRRTHMNRPTEPNGHRSRPGHRVRVSLYPARRVVRPFITVAAILALASLCVAGVTSAPPALVISPAAGAEFACVFLVSAIHQ